MQNYYSETPWKWQWATPRIKNPNQQQFWTLFILIIFWNSLSLFLLVVLIKEVLTTQNYLALLILFFPVSGAFMTKYLAGLYFQGKRFKNTSFELSTYPAALGHYLSGDIRVEASLPPDTTFIVKLTCLHCYISGSGKNASHHEKILWQDEQHIPHSVGRQKQILQIPVLFQLPDDQPVSTDRAASDQYVWQLEVSADLKGPDYKQIYKVPVFDPKAHPEIIPTPIDFESEAVKANLYTYEGDVTKTGLYLDERAGGTYYYFPSGQHTGAVISLAIVALILWVITIGIWVTEALVILTVICASCAAFTTYGSIAMWLHKSSVDITASELTLRRGWFSGKTHVYLAKQIKSLFFKTTTQSGTNRYYDIHAETKDGKKLKLAKHLRGRKDVEKLVARMRAELGLREQKHQISTQ